MIFTQDKKKRKGTTINVQMLGRNETVVLHKPGRFEYQRKCTPISTQLRFL